MRFSELDTGLSSSDKAMEVDTAVLAPPSLNPSSSSHTMLRAFHALKEVCSLDEDNLFRDRFQLPDKTKILLPCPNEKACTFNPGEVCFYEVAFLSGLKFPVHPFVMKLLHHLGNLCQTPGGSSSVAWRSR